MDKPLTYACERFESELDPYLDGELDQEARTQFEAHPHECGACAGLHNDAIALRDALRGLPELRAPERVVSEALRKARGEAETRDRWSLRGLFAQPAVAALAAVLLVALALSLVVMRGSSPGPQEVLALDDPKVVRATLEMKLALAHVAQTQRRVARGLGEDLIEERLLAPTARSVSRALGTEVSTGTDPLDPSGGRG